MKSRLSTQLHILLIIMAISPLRLSAQSLPPGSYTDTCIEARIDKDRHLYARCRNKNGELKNTFIGNFAGCSGRIWNDDGRLSCKRSEQFIRGSYTKSCGFIHWERYGKLYAFCQDEPDRIWTPLGGFSKWFNDYHENELEWQRCHGDIRNMWGHLDCTFTPRSQLPKGSYIRTCRRVERTGNRLEATCRRIDKAWSATFLDEVNRCLGDVSNNDGRLTCQKSPLNDTSGAARDGFSIRRQD